MDDQQLLATAGNFAIAILLGALVGVEREKRKSEEEDTGHIAGLRTFTLLALLGAVAGWLSRETSSPWILAAAVLVVGALITAGYFVNAKPGPDGKGLTTEVAEPIVFLLGAMVMLGDQELAIGVGVLTAAVLAYKQPLHGFVEKLGWDDVYASVRLLIATFIALPLLPNEAIDPWGALNPYKLWLLVILIEPVAGRLCADALAWTSEGRGADRADRRSCFIHGGHVVILARSARKAARVERACLRHPALLGRDVRPHHRVGGDRQSHALDPRAGSVRGDGSHCRRLRGIPLFS
jgi:MgtC family